MLCHVHNLTYDHHFGSIFRLSLLPRSVPLFRVRSVWPSPYYRSVCNVDSTGDSLPLRIGDRVTKSVIRLLRLCFGHSLSFQIFAFSPTYILCSFMSLISLCCRVCVFLGHI